MVRYWWQRRQLRDELAVIEATRQVKAEYRLIGVSDSWPNVGLVLRYCNLRPRRAARAMLRLKRAGVAKYRTVEGYDPSDVSPRFRRLL